MKLVRNRGSLVLFLVILAIEVLIALYVEDRLIRPYGGDTLAVVLVYALIRTFYTGPAVRALLCALAVAFAVELAQHFQIVARLGLSHNVVARTVIGTSFDWGDIAAYCLGAAAIAALSVRGSGHRGSDHRRSAAATVNPGRTTD